MRARKGSLLAATGRREAGGSRLWAGLALIGAVLLALLVLAGSARADARPVIANEHTYTSSHFVIHYDSTKTAATYAQAADVDFEGAYARLVTGGGGTPNAGLLAPVDVPADVYLNLSQNQGGDVRRDDGSTGSAFIEMDPSMAADQFQFRSGHELMHVIEDRYTPAVQVYSLITEGTADWAAGYSHPDTPAQDNNFSNTNRPLDCSYANWPASSSTSCGNGYWQWLFIERQVEDHGVGFVGSLWQQAASYCSAHPGTVGCGSSGDSSAVDRTILGTVLGTYGTNVSSAFAKYAALVWDPKAWTTAGLDATMHDYYLLHPIPNPQYVDLTPAVPDSGSQATSVDHLAARYAMVRTTGASGSADQLQVTVTKPGGVSSAPVVLSDTGPAGQRTITTMTNTGGSSYRATVPFDPASTADVVIALVNDSLTDGLSFTWRAVLLPGTPAAAPVSDTLSGSPDARLWLGQNLGVDAGHATGGTTETPCSYQGTYYPTNAVRGVWLWFTAQANGQYTFDSTPSDFTAEMSLGRTDGYCWTSSDGGPLAEGKLITTMSRGQGLYVFVARSQLAIGNGHTIRMTVTGPDGVPFPPEITSPVNNWTTTSGTFTVSGRSAEPGSTVSLYDAGRSLGLSTSAGADGHWSITVTGAANGVRAYEAKASNSYGTSGLSGYVIVNVKAPAAPAADTTAPAVKISAPGDKVTVASTPITVTGTATDDIGVASVTVNGTPVTVGPGGGWSAQVALSSGSNTITATATDAAGNHGHAQVTVTYRPAIVPPPPSAVSVTLIGPLRFDGKAVLVLLRCNSTAGASCRGAITVSYLDRIRVRVNGKLRTRTVARVIASSHYVLAPARRVLVSARLNRTGATLLVRKHTMKVTVLITVTQPSGKRTVVAKQSPTLTRKKGTQHS